MPVRNRRAGVVLLILSFLLLATSSWAQALPSQGILWKVEGPRPSHIMGTIHLADPRVTDLPGAVWDAFRSSSTFAMEVLMEPQGILQLGTTILAEPGGPNLEQRMPRDDFEKLKKALAERGLPPMMIPLLKPWVLSIMISMPAKQMAAAQTALPLDLLLHQRAAAQGKKLVGLEKMEEQIALFDRMSADEQIRLLTATVRYQDRLNDSVEQLISAYQQRDLQRLGQLMEEGFSSSGIDASLRENLLARRNRVMVERMTGLIRNGGAFIAVGAGHLVGEEGILRLLERQGFRLRPIY